MSTLSILTRRTSAPINDVCARLPEIAQQHKFGLLGIHDLKEKMAAKGLTFDRECRVFEVCNPQQAHDILTGDITVSAALPCRISVYADGKGTALSTIDPLALLGLFGGNSAEEAGIAKDVKTTLLAIMDEACGAPAKAGGSPQS